jgi:hypothetical protein
MLRKIFFLLPFFCLTGLLYLPNVSFAQNWPIIYGDDFHALIKNLSETYDKGFYLTAFTYDNQGVNKYGWIIKTDINGNILWDKKFGVGNERNWFSDSFLTTDHGLIISGVTTKYSAGDFDPIFFKLDICGEIEWCKVFQSPDQNYGTGIIQLADGSYIGMLQYYGEGETYARINLVKMDQSGEPVWIQRQSQEDTLIYNEEGASLNLTSTGNYLISGSCNHPGWRPYFILTDTLGLQIWDIIWSSEYGTVWQTIEQKPGIFYSIGFKIPPGHNNLPAVYKFDQNGLEITDFLIVGDTISRGGGGSIININDSTLLTGIVWGSNNSQEIFSSEVIKTDTLGTLIKRRLLLLDDQAPTSMLLTSDNKILVSGTYFMDGNLDIYLWKMNAELEDDTLYTQPLTYDSLCPYQILSDTVDLDCSLFVNINEIPTKEEYESTIKISPNPARDWITLSMPDNISSGNIEIAIYNIFGQEILKTGVILQNRTASLNVSNLPSGFYLAVCKDLKRQVFKGKFVVVR